MPARAAPLCPSNKLLSTVGGNRTPACLAVSHVFETDGVELESEAEFGDAQAASIRAMTGRLMRAQRRFLGRRYVMDTSLGVGDGLRQPIPAGC